MQQIRETAWPVITTGAMGTGVFGEAVYIRLPSKRRRLLYILTLQYILDLTVQNDVICKGQKVRLLWWLP